MAETPQQVEVNVVMGAQLRAVVRSALLHVRKQLDEVTKDWMTLEVIDKELEKWPLSMEGDNVDTLPQWLFYRYDHSAKKGDGGTGWNHLPQEDKQFWEHEAAAVRRAVGRGGFKTSPEHSDIEPVNALNDAWAKSRGEVKGYIQLDLKSAESLGEAIRMSVGAASMCWMNMRQAGVFKSEVALDIATQLEHHFHYLLRLMNASMGERHQALADHLQKYWTSGVPMIAVSQVRDILTGRAMPEEYKTALQVRPNTTDEANRG